MKLIADGASPLQIAAGEIAATTFLDACGVKLDQVVWAWSVYERWIEGCSGPNNTPPKEGAEIRRVWQQAQTLAIATACPHRASNHFLSGHYQLYWYDPKPALVKGWERLVMDEGPHFDCVGAEPKSASLNLRYEPFRHVT